jgi:hypothetical protein
MVSVFAEKENALEQVRCSISIVSRVRQYQTGDYFQKKARQHGCHFSSQKLIRRCNPRRNYWIYEQWHPTKFSDPLARKRYHPHNCGRSARFFAATADDLILQPDSALLLSELAPLA